MRLAPLIIASILMLSFIKTASAEYWIGLAMMEDRTELIADAESIKTIMGDRVAIWTYRRDGTPFFLKDGRVRFAYRTRYFADCTRNQIGTNEDIWYDSSGKVLKKYFQPIPAMELTTPNTNGESVFKFACDSAHRREQIDWYESLKLPQVVVPPL